MASRTRTCHEHCVTLGQHHARDRVIVRRFRLCDGLLFDVIDTELLIFGARDKKFVITYLCKTCHVLTMIPAKANDDSQRTTVLAEVYAPPSVTCYNAVYYIFLLMTGTYLIM